MYMVGPTKKCMGIIYRTNQRFDNILGQHGLKDNSSPLYQYSNKIFRPNLNQSRSTANEPACETHIEK